MQKEICIRNKLYRDFMSVNILFCCELFEERLYESADVFTHSTLILMTG